MGFLSSETGQSQGLLEGDLEWLHLLVGDWQIVSDLAFADLALWLPDEAGEFRARAHVRPSTAHTKFPIDFVGDLPSVSEDPLIRRAYAEGETQRGEGIAAVPMRRRDRSVAVVTLHRSASLGGTGELEHAYHDAADELLEMGRLGLWPESSTPTGSRRGAPRVGDGFMRLAVDGTVVYASPNAVSAFRRLGIVSPLVGRSLTALTSDLELTTRLADESLPLVLRGRMPWRSEIEAQRTTLTLRSIPLRARDGRTGAILLCRDVSELRRREKELVSKDATIREIHHRVKNNLQTVSALLRMQSRRMQSDEAREGLSQAMRRVETIARVHEALSHGLSQSVDFDELIERQLRLAAEIASNDQRIETVFEGRFGYIPSDSATPLALVVNELVSNAVEHGFAGRKNGQVTLTARRTPRGPDAPEGTPDRLTVTVADDGAGYAAAAGQSAKGSGLGTQIVKTLVRSELGGSIEWKRRPAGGTAVTLEMTVEKAR
ncbi:sensor histidine kinase [Arthrobacter sp. UM1]|uniref:sensor histidine kinase n=1 Tax=Arthrobacter sp. UM1 TaxID=2766776 RepID=UPI001CF64BDA|nr:PAS domain-containing sensor histidine kinase [Arthrobacter sp. UM1]MCB4207771.1 PAS domain-containing sensor histidine kinase [Arthrobacter sp. UM1]